MPPETATTVSPTSVAWNWAIETLADLKDCNFLALAEVVRAVPDVLKHHPSGGAARERVALRFLEECVDSSGIALGDVGEGEDSVVIDADESSEDVLCRFLRKVKNVDNGKAPNDLAYMHGVCQFILRKKAALPKICLSRVLVGDNKQIQGNRVDHSLPNTGKNKDVEELKTTRNGKQVATGADLVGKGKVGQNDKTEHQKPIGGREGNVHLQRLDGTSKSFDQNIVGYRGDLANGITKTMPPVNRHICFPDEHDKAYDGQSDEDVPLDEGSALDTQKRILFAEKCKILNSQYSNILSQDGTEGRSCIKCDGEGGQLLFCSENDCPIAIHESCLESSTSFDDMGKFYCPFCSYIQAATAYCNAKKKVSMARKTLSSFISWDPGQKRNIQEQLVTKSPSHLKRSSGEIREDNNQANPESKQLSNLTQQHRRLSDCADKNSGNIDGTANLDDFRCTENHQGSLQQHADVATNSGEMMDATVSGKKDLPTVGDVDRSNNAQSMGEQGQQTEIAQKGKSKWDDGLKHTSALDNQGPEDAATSSSNRSTSEEMTGSEPSAKRRKKCLHSPEEDNSSFKHKTSKRYANRYTNTMYPHGRRNKLPWTEEEEGALKDAVHKFSQTSKGVFPWIKILEHGRHIFHRTRQPMDLKDKWRNIQRKEEKALAR